MKKILKSIFCISLVSSMFLIASCDQVKSMMGSNDSDEEQVDEDDDEDYDKESKYEKETEEVNVSTPQYEAAVEPVKLKVKAYPDADYLEPQGNNTYYPDNLVDGNQSTGWAVNLPSVGYQNYEVYGPTLKVEPGMVIDYITIVNGYGKDQASFKNNTRASWIKILRASDNGDEQSNIIYEGPLADTMSPQKLAVNPKYDFSRPSDNIMLIFPKQSVRPYYMGAKWKDLVISEIEFWGHPRK